MGFSLPVDWYMGVALWSRLTRGRGMERGRETTVSINNIDDRLKSTRGQHRSAGSIVLSKKKATDIGLKKVENDAMKPVWLCWVGALRRPVDFYVKIRENDSGGKGFKRAQNPKILRPKNGKGG